MKILPQHCLYAVDLCRPFCRSQPRHGFSDNDDDDDDVNSLIWVQQEPTRPSDTTFQSSGHGPLGFHEGHIGACLRWDDDSSSSDDIKWAPESSHHVSHIPPAKENRARFPSSYPLSMPRHQHSGPSRRNSGPFSGQLTGAAKTCSVPSIIPAVLRRKNLNFQACEPSSPKVTCLGQVRIKEIVLRDVSKSSDGTEVMQISPDSRKQTWEKTGKARRKKKQACGKDGCLSRRRRYDSKVSNIMPAEMLQSRRERAAALARSLTGLIEDLRSVEKDDRGYVPTVPPPNSLLIMRGCRKMEAIIRRSHEHLNDMSGDDDNKCLDFSNTFHELHSCCKAIASKVSNSLAHLIDAEVNGIPKDDDDDEDDGDDDNCRHGTEAEHQRSCLFEKESDANMVSASLMEGKEFPAGVTLWQRRALARLPDIEVRKHC